MATTLPVNSAAAAYQLVTRACERAGLDDFGDDSWREGLRLLVDRVESTPGVNAGGRDFVYGQFVAALWNRLRIVDYLRQHPEVSEERVERPLVVPGLPRTGTSLASYLLDQDPQRRSLLTWEAEDSVPPSTPGTLHHRLIPAPELPVSRGARVSRRYVGRCVKCVAPVRCTHRAATAGPRAPRRGPVLRPTLCRPDA
nr:hypothetical protein MFLOJ_41580 [Mycobacterium florentinum]